MLVAAAVCPHPPLLVPELAAGAAHELDDLRAACDAAVSTLLQAEADLLVVVGAAPSVGPVPESAWGSLAPYGVDIRVGVDPADGPPTLPLSLIIGRWLLDRRNGSSTDTAYFGVITDAPAERCRQLGVTLAERAPRVAMLVMGDASARRSVKGPGYLDPRAEPFDASVSRALRAADTEAILALDQDLAAELLVAGRAAWQLLAGAAQDRAWSAEVTFDDAPYGVTYLVSTWSADRPD